MSCIRSWKSLLGHSSRLGAVGDKGRAKFLTASGKKLRISPRDDATVTPDWWEVFLS